MKTCILSVLAASLLVLFSGCAHEDDSGRIPPPTITDAVYWQGVDQIATITGDFFKAKSTYKGDVIVSLNGRNWTPAKKIMESSATKYVAVLPYGPDFPEVWVRVYGINEKFSDPYLVHAKGSMRP